jgi:hypothetical protein
MEKAQKCRSVESGNLVDSQRHPGGEPPIKARPYFLRLTSRHQTEDDLLRSPKAGVLDQPVEPPSRAHPLKRRFEYFVWGMRPGNALECERRTGITCLPIPGFLIRFLGFLIALE